jgi:glycosyltransferase involved in cell wall biosynthesis
MRILFLTDGISPYVTGGMQKFATGLCEELAIKGVRIELAHCTYKKNNHIALDNIFSSKARQNIQIQHFHFPEHKIRFLGHYVWESWQYSQMLWHNYENQLQEFDAILAQGFCAWAFFGKKIKTPIFMHPHGLEMFQKSFSLLEKLQKIPLQLAMMDNIQKSPCTISLGGNLNQILAEQGAKRVEVIPNAIAEDFGASNFSKQHNTEKNWVFIGRNEHRKGLFLIHEYFKHKANFSANLHIIGEVAEKDKLQKSFINYHGKCGEAEIKNWLAKSDIILCPSLSEGMPTVLLEAMAFGVMPIASDVGAVRELLDDSNGILIAPNSLESLAMGIAQAENMQAAILQQKQQNAWQKSKNYHWDKVADLFIHLFTNA